MEKAVEQRKRSKRYDTSDMVEAQFEPGSNNKVLKNLLRIKTVEKILRILLKIRNKKKPGNLHGH